MKAIIEDLERTLEIKNYETEKIIHLEKKEHEKTKTATQLKISELEESLQ
jgi:hypothetical protein